MILNLRANVWKRLNLSISWAKRRKDFSRAILTGRLIAMGRRPGPMTWNGGLLNFIRPPAILPTWKMPPGMPAWPELSPGCHWILQSITSIWVITKREVPGGLVDGPVYGSIYRSLAGLVLTNPDEFEKVQNDFVVYHDDIGDYSTNEPTMDGTAGAIMMMAYWAEH